MSALVDLHPDAGHAVWDLVAEVHALLDARACAARAPLPSGEYAALVAEVDRAVRRLDAVKLRLIAAADHAEVGALSGMPNTGAWLARQTRATGAVAAGQVALAASLAELPTTSAALDAGEVSAEHAAVIAGTSRQLPRTLDADQRAAVESRLVHQAKQLDPAALRKKARQALTDISARAEAQAHHDQVLRDEEAAARARTRLVMRDNSDGTISGHFTVPTLAGAILRKVLQQLASPRRARQAAADLPTGPATEQDSADALDWARRQGQAFVELLEHLPTDRLHSKVAATVVVRLDRDQLLGDLRAAGLDTGHEISCGEARRLACNAGVLPAVLGGSSLPLDLGRQQRFYTEAQRVALATVYESCAADGCDRPYAWCDLHHDEPWSAGGATDLENGLPLCGFHHQRIHDPTYDHRRHRDRSVTFHRRT